MNTVLTAMDGFAAIFTTVGWIGAGMAVLCALVAAFGLAANVVGPSAGAVGLWIVGAMLALGAAFSQNWIPLFIAIGALAVALVIGAVLHVIVHSVNDSRERRGHSLRPELAHS